MDYMTLRWDSYLEVAERRQPFLARRLKDRPCRLRSNSMQSFMLYRQLGQLVDSAVLVSTSIVQFERSKIVIGALYLVLRAEYECSASAHRDKYLKLHQ